MRGNPRPNAQTVAALSWTMGVLLTGLWVS
jgi:hypothetical protein